MVTAFMTWCGVVTLICAIVLTRVIVALAQRHHHHQSKRLVRVVQMSNEREMLFVPGDTVDSDGIDKDYNPDDQ